MITSEVDGMDSAALHTAMASDCKTARLAEVALDDVYTISAESVALPINPC